MRVQIDPDQLLAEGLIDHRTYQLLIARNQSSIVNRSLYLVLALCICGFVAAIILLDPSYSTLPMVGCALTIVGTVCVHILPGEYKLIAQVAAAIGALVVSGWVVYTFSQAGTDTTSAVVSAWLIVTTICFSTGILTRNVLLVGAAVFATVPIVNASLEYERAVYSLTVSRPFLTMCVYVLVSVAGAGLAYYLKGWPRRVVVTIFAVALFMANLALWVGSIWGDPFIARIPGINALYVPHAFAVFWALLVLPVFVWAYVNQERWTINLTFAFLVINAYTQWFERLSRNPWEAAFAFSLGAIICSGLIIYNKRATQIT